MRLRLTFDLHPAAPLACLILAGCRTVGPDYAGPPAMQAAANPDFARAGELAGGQVLAEWWKSLNDPLLDELVMQSLDASPNLGVLQARLRQARALLRTSQANSRPNGSATMLAAHARLPTLGGGGGGGGADGNQGEGAGASGLSLPSSLNLYSVGFDATWEIDLFGGQRRAVEAAGAQLEAAEASLVDARLSLSAEVAQVYVNLRATQARIQLSDASIARQERMLALTGRRVKGGTASQLDLARLQGQLEATRAEAQPLLAQLDAARDALAWLTGNQPGALDARLTLPPDAARDALAALPLPPAEVHAGDPAAMLRRRPDIRAAERQLAARTAQIGQAEAARFPRLTLLGLIGIGGTRPSDLTRLDDYSAVLAPQLSWSFLDFGRSGARIDAARAQRDEAEAQYRASVLAALRDAEDALSRFRQRRATVATAARAKAALDHASVLMEARQRAGTASLIDVLDAQRQQLAAGENLAQAEAALTTDFVALHKALGLGYAAPGIDTAAR